MKLDKDEFFLGFDLSTQTLKAAIIDNNGDIVCEASVDPELDLPQYETIRGHYEDGDHVTTPLVMWLDALEMVLERIQIHFPDFRKIKALSGGTQQCGSMYWKHGANEALQHLNSDETLSKQIKPFLAEQNASIWLDSSSRKFCEELCREFGVDYLLDTTGYVPTLGLAGPRVYRTAKTKRDVFENTERISMLSSFIASAFLGRLAPTDYQDGVTMMFFDRRNLDWSREICDRIDPELYHKLGPVTESSSIIGEISPYFVNKFKFDSKCKIVAWTGDNAGSIVGSLICDDDIFLTLGTGDCLEFLSKPMPKVSKRGGFFFIDPLDATKFARAIGWKNADFARDRVRKQMGFETWEDFENAVKSRPVGNEGYMGVYFFEPDVMPLFAHGVVRESPNREAVDDPFEPAIECRAIIESQMLNRRYDAENLGLHLTSDTRLLLTGGPSRSETIQQVAADVFGVPVYGMDTVNACSYGGALRAKYAIENRKSIDRELSQRKWKLLKEPCEKNVSIYAKMMQRYEKMAEPLVPPYFGESSCPSS